MILYFTNLGSVKIHSVTLIYFKEHYNTKKNGGFEVAVEGGGEEGIACICFSDKGISIQEFNSWVSEVQHGESMSHMGIFHHTILCLISRHEVLFYWTIT